MLEGKVREFGPYRLERLIGHGVTGAVYLAEDEGRGRKVALKVLPADVATNEEYTRRFLAEARLATQLSHPNIVGVYDYGRENGHFYLAMEYVEGESLKARMAKEGRLPWQEAVRIAIQVAEGLQAAAAQGVIHRDIKPENLLVNGNDQVRITDLGLAKEVGVSEPLPSDTSLGTPDYMSPEQVSNSETVDYRSDIYSLGATLFHMVCGKAPYTGRSAYEVMVMHVSAPLPSPRKYVPDLPTPVCDVMRKMMARDTDDRYQSYADLIADLGALLEGEPVSATGFADESLISVNGSNQDAHMAAGLQAESRIRPRDLLLLAVTAIVVAAFLLWLFF